MTAKEPYRGQSAAPSGPSRSVGSDLIAAERQRQINVEGWTPGHDAEHDEGELGQAAKVYQIVAMRQVTGQDVLMDADSAVIYGWPWDASWYKPSADPVRNLVKAGALIAAEIDRLSARQNDGTRALGNEASDA